MPHRVDKKCQVRLLHEVVPHWVDEDCDKPVQFRTDSGGYLHGNFWTGNFIDHLDVDLPSQIYLCRHHFDRGCHAENAITDDFDSFTP